MIQYLSRRRGRFALLLGLILVGGCCLPGASAAATLDTHTVVLDGQGEIIPWTTNPGDGYDRVMFLSWDMLLNRLPNDPNNHLPTVYTHSEYDPNDLGGTSWPNNPAGKNAMLADSASMYYFYSGNTGVVTLVSGLLNHQLQYGTTPANYFWAGVPYSTGAGGSVTYGNDSSNEGTGVLEPDKVGELGYHGYLRFYELTGNTNYLNAAIACANQLALHIRTGDATHSPWPFRVVAQTGATSQSEEYCADVVAPIRLFDELVRLGLGNTSTYQTARQTAWNWLMTYPMTNQVWANYFEDVLPKPNDLSNHNQYDPGETACYLLEHPELDTNWFNHVTNLLGYIETTFGGTDNGESGVEYGAHVISEQDSYRFKMASHTSRYAADYALLYSLTGDTNALDKAYRSLNWCTYMCRTNDVVIEGPAEFVASPPCWFTDGHGDYIRHFMLALGAVPEWAPAGQNHITGSTTVIQSVTYATDSNSIAYTTFDNASTESFRVAFTPVDVFVNGTPLPQRSDLSQPGWVFTASNGVMRLRHDTGTNVQIVAGTPIVTLTNGISYQHQNNGVSPIEDCYRYTATDPVARLQFEILGPTADLTLVVRKGLPQPGLGLYDYISANPGTNDEFILVLTNSSPVAASAGDWYLTAINRSGAAANYAIQATQWSTSGQPIILTSVSVQGDSLCFSWNSQSGASYVVQGKASLANADWTDVSDTITATGATTSYCEPLPSPYQFFRVAADTALN
jgi:hypothetical protein